ELGKPRMQAAFDGAKEIAFAILATTITLVAVFIPVAFLTGRIGRLFNEFGLAVAVSVLLSGFVALTLTPMLCSRVLRPHEGKAPGEGRLMRFYDRVLGAAMRHRWMVLAGSALVGVLIVLTFQFKLIPSEQVPSED